LPAAVVNTISPDCLILVLLFPVCGLCSCLARPAETMAEINLENVTKVFQGGIVAVDDVSLEIGDGEFIVLVGPSGCGKSTLLRMIAGLEEVTDGRISIDGRDVTDLAPRRRDIAMVFQSYALYPHMTVRQNIGYGLKVRRTSKAETKRRVEGVAAMLGLETMLDRRPAHLSGGQRQRVAMGRAIVREPKAFLMDEPLSNLDAKLRVGMRASLAQLHARLGTTTVYVTHDQTEAMTLGQRVAVMRDGRVLQVDSPQRLYREPRDLFVAAFIGTPAMNLVEATIDGNDAVFGQFRVPLEPARRPPPSAGNRVVLGIRPESFQDAATAPAAAATIEVVPAVVEELGSDAYVFFGVDAPKLSTEAGGEGEDDATLLAEEKALFSARVDPRTPAHVGEPLTLAVDANRFHFFDRETGASLLDEREGRPPKARDEAMAPAAP
jgi:multiple sugar transport system ATP-binding protein